MILCPLRGKYRGPHDLLQAHCNLTSKSTKTGNFALVNYHLEGCEDSAQKAKNKAWISNHLFCHTYAHFYKQRQVPPIHTTPRRTTEIYKNASDKAPPQNVRGPTPLYRRKENCQVPTNRGLTQIQPPSLQAIFRHAFVLMPAQVL